MAELTPMKRQYQEMKQRHPDCLLFFRLGDFYEMFGEDAKLASKELELTLTTRDRGKPEGERTPMCGVPYHSAEAYIARLIAKGYKVAICEQMEDPATAKGLVDREVIRIVTPGTVISEGMLEEGRNNLRHLPGLPGDRPVLLRHLHRGDRLHQLLRPGGRRASAQRAGPLPAQGGGALRRGLCRRGAPLLSPGGAGVPL